MLSKLQYNAKYDYKHLLAVTEFVKSSNIIGNNLLR